MSQKGSYHNYPEVGQQHLFKASQGLTEEQEKGNSAVLLHSSLSKHSAARLLLRPDLQYTEPSPVSADFVWKSQHFTLAQECSGLLSKTIPPPYMQMWRF